MKKKPISAFEHSVYEILPSLEMHFPNASRQIEERTFNDSQVTDLDFPKSDGSLSHLRLYISSLKHRSGKPQGRILVFQDVTQIKKIELEKKRVEDLALVGELAAGIAHEIRNPMASISGSIEILKDEIMPNDLNKRLIDIIYREIERLNRLVNDFLLFARPGESKVKRISLNSLIMESLELIQNSRHWNKNIKIFTKTHPHTIIESDPDQIRQVLWNLFINAADAMETGGELYIETSPATLPSKKGAEGIRIVIRDTGRGFDEEGFAHLFMPFFTTKKTGSGTGTCHCKENYGQTSWKDLWGKPSGGRG